MFHQRSQHSRESVETYIRSLHTEPVRDGRVLRFTAISGVARGHAKISKLKNYQN